MIKDAIFLLKETFAEWSEDGASRLAAALSYYTLFSLAPLLVIIIAILSLFVGGSEKAQAQIMLQIDGMIGEEGAEAVGEMLANASRNEEAGIIATVVSVVTLAFAAMGVFGQLYESLNDLWEIHPINTKKGVVAGLLYTLQRRFFSFTMVLGVGFLLLVSLVISAGLSAFAEFSAGVLPLPPIVLQAINFIVSLGVITLMFALLYKVVPEAKIAWKDALIGALVTGLLFTLGKQLIGVYLGRSSTASSFGAAASFIVIMLWVYYSAQIFFLGAEFTQVYATHFGKGIVPENDAISVPDLTTVREAAIEAANRGGEVKRRDIASEAVRRQTTRRQDHELVRREKPQFDPEGRLVARAVLPARMESGQYEHLILVEEEEPAAVGPFAAAGIAFITFVTGILLGLVRGSREKRV